MSYETVLEDMKYRDVEIFRVICLNEDDSVNKIKDVASGDCNTCSVNPDDVYTFVSRFPCKKFIIAHNHPDSISMPSGYDRDLTKTIEEGAKERGLELIEHLIVSKIGGCFNMIEASKLRKKLIITRR